MRTLLAITILILSAISAEAQDDAAAQAAQQAAQQATQMAQQQMVQLQQYTQQMSDQMTQQTMQNLSDASNAAQDTAVCCAFTATPTFSVKPGTYSGTTTVKIRDKTRGAVIYYTTDGWTPTTSSTRYTGPVTIDSTTTLQAIAIGPYTVRRSMVASAQYTINGTQRPPSKASTSAIVASSIATGSAILRQGTPVHLVFATDVNSKTADVGDKIQLTLAEDIKAGEMVLVPKGSPALATVTQVDKTGAGARRAILYSK
jgi:hypothetical protein